MNRRRQHRTDASDLVKVRRFDRAEAVLDPAETTVQGYLRVHAAVALPGIMEYRDASGKVTRELISAEELHRTDSLQTLASVPVTLEHPEEEVTPENVGELGVGDVSEEIEILEESGHVRITLVVRRKDSLAAVRSGKIEISPGYDTFIDPTPGRHPEFGAYDAVQRGRIYNHVALVDEARGGPTIKLRADSDRVQVRRLDAVSTKPKSTPRDDRGDSPSGGTMNPHLLLVALTLGLPLTTHADGKVYHKDQEGEEKPTPLTEEKVSMMIREAIANMEKGDQEPAPKDDQVEEEKAALRAQIAELTGKLQALEKEKTDREADMKMKADVEERKTLDALAKSMKFDTASWRQDTTNEDRKLDLVRAAEIVEKDAKPEPAIVNGMISVLQKQHADSKPKADSADHQWKGLEAQVDEKPEGRDDAKDKEIPDDPFRAAVQKLHARD